MIDEFKIKGTAFVNITPDDAFFDQRWGKTRIFLS